MRHPLVRKEGVGRIIRSWFPSLLGVHLSIKGTGSAVNKASKEIGPPKAAGLLLRRWLPAIQP